MNILKCFMCLRPAKTFIPTLREDADLGHFSSRASVKLLGQSHYSPDQPLSNEMAFWNHVGWVIGADQSNIWIILCIHIHIVQHRLLFSGGHPAQHFCWERMAVPDFSSNQLSKARFPSKLPIGGPLTAKVSRSLIWSRVSLERLFLRTFLQRASSLVAACWWRWQDTDNLQDVIEKRKTLLVSDNVADYFFKTIHTTIISF